ncbi:MAG: SDR family NAD(P)-dependent oxidoreductase [Microcoleaceae cyanobacterium]
MTGNNALIVGASKGIGLGFVQHLLSDAKFDKVYAGARSVETATELQQIAAKYPEKFTGLTLDITHEPQVAAAMDQIQAEVEQLHLVINCVGLLHDGPLQPEKSLRQTNMEQLARYFQVNSIGAVLLAKHLMPLLKHKERSVFASISAKVGSIGDNRLGGWYGYRASKAALNMFMKTVAIEYSRRCPQTIVVALHPGTTDTQLSKPFQRNVPPEKLFSTERTTRQLLQVIQNLEIKDSGEFFSWDGSPLPW